MRVAPAAAERQPSGNAATAQVKADVARFFTDLRRTIGATLPQAAANLKTHTGAIVALEHADVAALPPWPQTERLVMNYAAWAGIDGRPVLNALDILRREAEHHQQVTRLAYAVRPAVRASNERLVHMRLAIAEGAKRLPREALEQARARPVQTFYTLSLPLGVLIVLFNSNILAAALNHVPKPIRTLAHSVEDMLAVNFAPTREGLRWIEVRDPRSRRADKLERSGHDTP